MTNEELDAIYAKARLKADTDDESNRQLTLYEYQRFAQADANYAKRELLFRVGGDGFMPQMERFKGMYFDSPTAGPDPLGDIATYLESLISKLELKQPSQRNTSQ